MKKRIRISLCCLSGFVEALLLVWLVVHLFAANTQDMRYAQITLRHLLKFGFRHSIQPISPAVAIAAILREGDSYGQTT